MKWWPITNPPWLIFIPIEMCLAFTAMKLVRVIDWQWWVVASPIWGAVALFWLAVAFFGVVFGLARKD